MIIESIKSAFKEHFNRVPIIVRSPGSINLIGEQAYSNDGYVLTAAIDIAIYVAVSRRSDDEIKLYAESFGEAYQAKLADLKKTERDWVNYILGVADQLQKWGYHIGGFNLYIDGDVPLDVALCSSAAITCAVSYALIELFSLSVPKLDIAKIAQMAEHSFDETNNHIAAQFTSIFGKNGNAILLDGKNLSHDRIPLKMDGYQFVLLDIGANAALPYLGDVKGKQRHEEGLELVKGNVANITSLRDVTLKMLDKYVKRIDIDAYQNCKLIVEENQLVLNAAEQLKNGNLKGFGQVMFQAHIATKEYYKESAELDFLFNVVKKLPCILGARMLTGKFEGCVLSIVDERYIDDFIEELTSAFEENFVLKLDAYVIGIEDGTTLIL